MAALSWKSGVSGSWTTAADWIPAVVPAAGDDVSIAVGGSYIVSAAALQVALDALTVSAPGAILAIDATGAGGSNIAVTGTLGNSGHIEIGNLLLSVPITVSVNGLANLGEIDLTGSAAAQASLLVEPAGGSLTGKYFLSGNALLAYELGGVTAIGNSAELSLTGPKARVALGSAPDSSSALSGLGSSLGTLRLEGGASVATAVGFVNNGIVDVDDSSGSGGSRLLFGGVLTNRGNLVIGNALLDAATLVTAADLVNAREIALTGSGAIQATLDIAAAAPATFTGINLLGGDALLEYGSGAISNIVIGSQLTLSGSKARVALASATGSNSALTNLKGNAGTFDLENGAVVTIAGSFTNTGLSEVDTGSGAGGSSLKIGTTLTNSAIISPNGLKIGNTILSAATLVEATGLVNTGLTDLTGALSVQATLDIGAAATPTLMGDFFLANDALLEFSSGAITGIGTGAELSLDGAGSRVALASADGSNSAITKLATNLGTLVLNGGAEVVTAVGFANGNLVEVDDAGGGSSLTIGGSMTNTGHIVIGNTLLAGATNVAAKELQNTGEIDLVGAPLVQATLDIAAAAPSTLTGIDNLGNDALFEYGSGAITAIGSGAQLSLNGAHARVALASGSGSNSALRRLASNAGTLRLENGGVISTTTDFLNAGILEVDDIGGGSRLTIGAALTNTGRVAIGNVALGAPTILSASVASNGGEIDLTSGRTVQATLDIAGALSNAGLVQVDAVGASGGSRLTIGGTLTNDGVISKGLRIGNIELSVPTVVTAAFLSNPGEIDLAGAPSVQATLDTAAAAPATLTGIYKLTNDALLEFSTGKITAIGGGAELLLSGAAARVADAAAAGGNSALTGLAANSGVLALEGGANLALTSGFSNGDLLVVDNLGGGGSSLRIGGVLDNSGTVDIGNSSSLSLATTVTAAGLDNLFGGSIVIAGRAAPATLTATGAAADEGSITVGNLGVLALGKSLSVASAAVLTVNGGEVSGGTLSGSGTMASGIASHSTLAGVTIAAGTSFAAGANSTLTLDHVTVAGALSGGGSAGLAFGLAGNDAMTDIAGFPTISLADGGANVLTLRAANFAGVTGGAITVFDGDGGTTLTASGLPSMDAVTVHAGSGIDKLTGGAGNDAFFAGGHTTMTGKTGANEFVFNGPGPGNVVADFAASAQNQIVVGNFGFSLAQSGASATPEQLPSNLFVKNATGKFTDTAQRFAYDTTNGKLFFAADGSGSTPELVATLANHPGLSASQLFFIT